ncbi:hypothetical protein KZX46_16005 [Polymorphobacter sp. PAMC 29334]|uniref:hypothetical protein n=1 Tax=Polymorphobacter sp. PAMC 29334 TaxID=2862331 RepID=UPI001C77F1CF|nr:hypothetical protein [Polymorphobacter sp. PAMC 29334]QYE34271.1 hypothetical protein KZX46_16005 [Polymorphobacter sp. PAMC 29334]
MPITNVFAYLIAPGKGLSNPPVISSKEIIIEQNKLSIMLSGVFSDQTGAHNFEITFNPDANGKQLNECRSLMLSFYELPSIATGLLIAQRLQNVTDNRSGTGLFFLLSGLHGLQRRLVMSRFPTDQAILADAASGSLDVEFLEQVFIKRLTSYKAAMVEHPSPPDGFWKGIATDRQAGQSGEHISEYWLRDFLNADFSETPAQGTRRLATALKEALKTNPNLTVKSEIAHASSLATAVFENKSLTIQGFCDHFALSTAAQETIKTALPKPSLFGKTFEFDANQFKVVAPFRTVEMNTGAILTAPSDEFEKIFETTHSGDIIEYKTRGRVSDQRLAKK